MSLTGTAKETLRIVEDGRYVSPLGRTVSLEVEIEAAISGTRLVRPGDRLSVDPKPGTPAIEVTSETTGDAARRLAAKGPVALLCFASAKNPGGGFVNGAKAQEEDLARCSALYACQLTQREFYAWHRARPSMLYSDHLIWSPEVPFFRDDANRLLETPFLASVITGAAPNAGEAARRGESGVVAALFARCRRVLEVAAANGQRRLVLGAWGCGVFRNDPANVADAWATGLADLGGWFDEVTFAVWQRSDAGPNLDAFERRFPAG
jgi:uncharacterized protein (TIGR02452 family)